MGGLLGGAALGTMGGLMLGSAFDGPDVVVENNDYGNDYNDYGGGDDFGGGDFEYRVLVLTLIAGWQIIQDHDIKLFLSVAESFCSLSALLNKDVKPLKCGP
ncbi:unnamed protein product [Ambrosiozyma monospora]|uniref:Unnamed protein product n=1 Tax=Ambrosiozyma monospora TaxID=43982 RepID=A0ACB5TCW2_AMBMO|nr:unnamed protein product [Ambrosiozyma monospora]